MERTRKMSIQSPCRRTILAAAAIVALAATSVGLFGLYGRNVVAAPSTQPQTMPVSVATGSWGVSELSNAGAST
jgi:hypothetical protein